MISRDKVLGALLTAVQEIQSASGRCADGLAESTQIFSDIDGFDSFNAIEVLISVGGALGEELPDELILGPSDAAETTLGALADRITAHMESDDGSQ